MAVDLNQLAEKLKRQKNVGVNRNGQLTQVNPRNDGSQSNANGDSTLETKRFFA